MSKNSHNASIHTESLVQDLHDSVVAESLVHSQIKVAELFIIIIIDSSSYIYNLGMEQSSRPCLKPSFDFSKSEEAVPMAIS
jgi:cytochrome b